MKYKYNVNTLSLSQLFHTMETTPIIRPTCNPENQDIWFLRAAADQAKNEYAFGQITREQAKERIQPYLDAVNEKSKEISKKYGKKHKDVSFIGFIR